MRWYWWLVIGALVLALVLGTTTMMKDKPRELVIPDDADVEALGRMLASENPETTTRRQSPSSDPRTIQIGDAWAAKNMAARVGKSVANLLMPGGIPGGQAGRYASTANPSTDATRSIAYDVLSGLVPDPTGGAVQFDAPRTQDALFAQGRVRLDAAGVAASRESEGKEVVYLPGVDPNYMRWWRYA